MGIVYVGPKNYEQNDHASVKFDPLFADIFTLMTVKTPDGREDCILEQATGNQDVPLDQSRRVIWRLSQDPRYNHIKMGRYQN